MTTCIEKMSCWFGLALAVQVVACMGCQVHERVEVVAWHEPSSLAGGCGGGKPDQGGVSFRVAQRGGEVMLEVEQDDWIDDVPPVVSTYPLTSEQWSALIEIARSQDLWNWRPTARPHDDCQTCWVQIDEHRASYCGRLDGPDRGGTLRRRLETLAMAAGWRR